MVLCSRARYRTPSRSSSLLELTSSLRQVNATHHTNINKCLNIFLPHEKALVRKVQTRFTLQLSNTNSREPPSSIRTSVSVLSAEDVPFAHQCQCKYVNLFPRIRLAVRNSSGWLVCARQVRPITFQVVPRISKWVPWCISRQTHNANRRETFHLERHDIPSLPPPASTSHTINLPVCTASD